MKDKLIIRSVLIGLIYVGFGTLSILASHPSSFFYGKWSSYGLLVTMPVSAVGFMYLFMEGYDLAAVLLIQVVTFLIFTFFVLVFLSRKNGLGNKS